MDCRIGKLRVRAARDTPVARVVHCLENALRTASFPGLGSGVLVVVRSVALRIGTDPTGFVSASRTLDQAIRRLTLEAVPAWSAAAGSAPAVWFRDALDPPALLALRLAQGRRAAEWFWKSAVIGWRDGFSRRAGLRYLVKASGRLQPARPAVTRLVATLQAAGRLDSLLDALDREDGMELLYLFGLENKDFPNLGLGARRFQRLLDRMNAEWRSVLARWTARWGEEDPRTLWLTAVALWILSPGEMESRWSLTGFSSPPPASHPGRSPHTVQEEQDPAQHRLLEKTIQPSTPRPENREGESKTLPIQGRAPREEKGHREEPPPWEDRGRGRSFTREEGGKPQGMEGAAPDVGPKSLPLPQLAVRATFFPPVGDSQVEEKVLGDESGTPTAAGPDEGSAGNAKRQATPDESARRNPPPSIPSERPGETDPKDTGPIGDGRPSGERPFFRGTEPGRGSYPKESDEKPPRNVPQPEEGALFLAGAPPGPERANAPEAPLQDFKGREGPRAPGRGPSGTDVQTDPAAGPEFSFFQQARWSSFAGFLFLLGLFRALSLEDLFCRHPSFAAQSAGIRFLRYMARLLPLPEDDPQFILLEQLDRSAEKRFGLSGDMLPRTFPAGGGFRDKGPPDGARREETGFPPIFEPPASWMRLLEERPRIRKRLGLQERQAGDGLRLLTDRTGRLLFGISSVPGRVVLPPGAESWAPPLYHEQFREWVLEGVFRAARFAASLFLWRREGLTFRKMAQRPGRIVSGPTHVDVFLPLHGIDVRIRRLGLDVNPGWVPWLARVVTFHYGD
ncbi:MAG: hypothetical protein H5U10_09365 [Desulfacinum sp.]|nr:hypothetical protein [Desulfacinum sp.]